MRTCRSYSDDYEEVNEWQRNRLVRPSEDSHWNPRSMTRTFDEVAEILDTTGTRRSPCRGTARDQPSTGCAPPLKRWSSSFAGTGRLAIADRDTLQKNTRGTNSKKRNRASGTDIRLYDMARDELEKRVRPLLFALALDESSVEESIGCEIFIANRGGKAPPTRRAPCAAKSLKEAEPAEEAYTDAQPR